MNITLSNETSRRAFLASGGIGLAALLTAAGAPVPSEPDGDLEKANLKILQDFCDAWSERDAEKLGAFFAEDAVFRMNERAPATKGKALIVGQFKSFLGMAKTARFEVLRATAIGNIVLNERIDHFHMGEKEVGYHMSGVFFLKDGKIAEWFDYGMPK